VLFQRVCTSCWSRFAGWLSSNWRSSRRELARAECLKCPTILRPTATVSATLLCDRRPSWTTSWRVWAVQGRLGSSASLMAFIIFLALSRSTTWTDIFGMSQVWSMLSKAPAMVWPVCEPRNNFACCVSWWRSIHCAVRKVGKFICIAQFNKVIQSALQRH